MRFVVLFPCVLFLQWMYTEAGPICYGIECVDGATCANNDCVCPSSLPKGIGRFYCYAGADRLVGMEYGDPYVDTFIPGESYKIPLPCGLLILRGNFSDGCYISVYANGIDLNDEGASIRNSYINGLEVIFQKDSRKTRMHIEDDVSYSLNNLPVDVTVSDGTVLVRVTECSTVLKYRHVKPYVIIDIPKSEDVFEGSMLPSKELHESLQQQAHRYNLTLRQETLYTVIRNIDSMFAECNSLHSAMDECTVVADEDMSTSICGQFVYSDNMVSCLSGQMSPKQLLQQMSMCIFDVCHVKKPPCDVIAKYFTTCKDALEGVEVYKCNM